MLLAVDDLASLIRRDMLFYIILELVDDQFYDIRWVKRLRHSNIFIVLSSTPIVIDKRRDCGIHSLVVYDWLLDNGQGTLYNPNYQFTLEGQPLEILVACISHLYTFQISVCLCVCERFVYPIQKSRLEILEKLRKKVKVQCYAHSFKRFLFAEQSVLYCIV